MQFLITVILIVFGLICFPYNAQAGCQATDKACLMQELKDIAPQIDNKSWRDKSYRELAKSYTYEGLEDKAIELIGVIQTPDTKAMTIRGIGFAAADNEWPDKERYNKLFKTLTVEANKIEHPPSKAIAFTYIAMAQAFAKDDAGAMKTAKSMENEALRHKAFAESAEIQAERGDFDAAMESIQQIGSVAFSNKAYGIISNIFLKKKMLQEAYNSANKITNFYKKAQALQNIINFGNEEESLVGVKSK